MDLLRSSDDFATTGSGTSVLLPVIWHGRNGPAQNLLNGAGASFTAPSISAPSQILPNSRRPKGELPVRWVSGAESRV